MLKLKSVDFGYFPFGPSCGQRTLYISFIDEEVPEDKIPEIETWVKDTFNSIVSQVEEKKVVREWEEVLFGQMHVVFDGEALARKENIVYSNNLLAAISKVSLDRQKNNTAVHKLRPPYLIFHGKAMNFTQPADFYENFQLLLVELPVCEGLTEETMTKYFKVHSLIEMSNHSFSSFIFRISCKEDIDRMVKFYLEEGFPSVDNQRIHIVPTKNDPALVQTVVDAARKYKLRLWCDASVATGNPAYLKIEA